MPFTQKPPRESATSLEAFIAPLPKAELHVHLEGSVRPATLRELSRTKGRLVEETENWIQERERQKFRYRGFQEFLDAFKLVALLLETPADYALATTRLCEWLAEQNVYYAEITLSAGVLLWKKQSVEKVFDAASAAASEAGARLGLRVNWIFDAIRHFGAEHARQVLAVAGRLRSRPALAGRVVAFGIGGDEARGPAELFSEVYREARDRGLHVTAHAGETCGPESIRAAIQILGAERVGHGLTAARDPEVMALLHERRIPLEICLSSNVATGLVARVDDHPLRELLDAGVLVTLNSDDPAMFGTSLAREFALAASRFALSRRQLLELSENAVRTSFLEEPEKRLLSQRIQSGAGSIP